MISPHAIHYLMFQHPELHQMFHQMGGGPGHFSQGPLHHGPLHLLGGAPVRRGAYGFPDVPSNNPGIGYPTNGGQPWPGGGPVVTPPAMGGAPGGPGMGYPTSTGAPWPGSGPVSG